jgi:alpha-ribazole phosphatase/probable phosphoglycerate mutase
MNMLPRPDDATRLVFVRHGEPEESARGRCYGKLDVGLSDAGREQVARVAAALDGTGLAAVYASPRRRSVESAEIVARPHGLAPIVLDLLREIDFGLFEGMAYDEAAARFPDVYRVWMERPTEVAFPEGESFAEMRGRVAEAVATIRSAHPRETAAVVSHGGTNRVAIAEALDLPSASVFRFDQSFASINVVDYFGETPVVRLLNGMP